MKKYLAVLIILCFAIKVEAQQNIVISNLSVTTQPLRFEIARMYIDVVNWNSTGTLEIDLLEKYYSAGLKKTYTISYGYQISPRSYLKDMSGAGTNLIQLSLGPEVTVSGNIKYVPIYVDMRYYAQIDVVLRTNWLLTTDAGNTSQHYLYYNQSPVGVNISDFTPDATAYLSMNAGQTILSGNVGIGTSSPDQLLTVNGIIHARQVNVDVNIPVPDYVFGKNYKLKTLSEVNRYVTLNKHLPGIPPAKAMAQKGINLTELNMKLLQKVEELTLYLVEKDQQVQHLQNEIDEIKKAVAKH